MKKILSLLLLLPLFTFSQNVGISGDINFNPSTTFDIDGGLRIRNLSTGVVTSTSTGVLNSTNGTSGQVMGSGPTWVDPKTFSWTITGNDNTSVSTNFIGTINNTGMVFRTNNIERMRLQSDGQLTIGSTVAGGKLDVHQTTSTAVARMVNYGNVPLIEVRRTQGTQTTPTTTFGANTVLSRIDGQGYNGSGFTSAARIEMATDADGGTSTDMPGRITFSTTPDGSGSLQERMIIRNNGTVRINSYTTNGIVRTTGGNGTLTSGGLVSVSEGGTGVGTVTGVVIGNGTSVLSGVTGSANQFLRRNAANTAYEFTTITPLSLGAPSGSGTTNYLARWTTANNLGIGATFDNGVNVGIGNTTPGAKLEVTGPATGSGVAIRAGGGGDVVLNPGGSLFFDGNYAYASGNYIRPMATNTQGFFTSGTERVRITSNGNVGIGTITPSFKLHVPSGYIGTDYINTTDNSVASGVTGVMIKAGDNYLRTGTAGAVSAFLNSTIAPSYANLTGIPLRNNWNGVHRNFVAEQLSWKNYGNGHTIFDASQGTSPQGTAVNNTNAQIAWSPTYPTIMGWNGVNTYGVRVDVARYAESAPGDNLGNHVATTTLNMNGNVMNNFRRIEPLGIGGNSGEGNNAYAIFQEGGAWNFPYPDLRIAYHTGIKLGANASYNGVRFYTDYDMSSLVMSVNDGSTGGAGNVFMSGKLGIGTTPVNNLHINGTSSAWPVRIQNNSGYIDFGPANTFHAHIYTDRPTFYLNKGLYAGDGNVLMNSNSGNSFINSGNLGLGTTSPSQKLDVRGNIYSSGQYYIQNASPTIYLQDTDHRSGMIHMNSNLLYFLNGSGVNSTTWSAINSEWPMVINMTNDDVSIGGVARIGDWGNCGSNYRINIGEYIGCEPIINTGVGNWGYVGTSSNYFYNMYSRNYYAASGYYYFSDKRFKENLRDIQNPLEKIKLLNGVIYDIGEGSQIYDDKNLESNKNIYGFIAQEVKEIIPSAVKYMDGGDKYSSGDVKYESKESDYFMGVNYGSIIPILVEAIKEQQKIIEDLNKRVTSLENK